MRVMIQKHFHEVESFFFLFDDGKYFVALLLNQWFLSVDKLIIKDVNHN